MLRVIPGRLLKNGCYKRQELLYTTTSKNDSQTSKKKNDVDVPGLSSKVLNVPSGAVGPGASKSGNYKNPEYFSYHRTSYFDAEPELAKYRLPQPSAKAVPN